MRLQNNRYLYLSLFLALLNMAVVFYFFGLQVYDDTPSYLEHINLFKGMEADINPWRMLTPLGPILALPFEFLGHGAGLIVENVIFYFLAVFLIFRIVETVTSDKLKAFWGTVLFEAALPMIFFGLSYMTDMGAWFFCLLSIYLTLLYFEKKNEKLLFLNGLISGIGVLMKVNGGLGVLFLPMMVMLSDDSFKGKISKIAKFGLLFLLPVLAFNVFSTLTFSYNLINGYAFNVESYSVSDWREQPGSFYADLNGPSAFLYAYAGDFLKNFGIIGLALSLVGLWRELRERQKGRLKIYLALLPLSAFFLIYPPTDSRFSFIAVPLLIIWATYGLAFLEKIFAGKLGALVVTLSIGLYVAANYYFCTVGSYRLILLQLINYLKL